MSKPQSIESFSNEVRDKVKQLLDEKASGTLVVSFHGDTPYVAWTHYAREQLEGPLVYSWSETSEIR